MKLADIDERRFADRLATQLQGSDMTPLDVTAAYRYVEQQMLDEVHFMLRYLCNVGAAKAAAAVDNWKRTEPATDLARHIDQMRDRGIAYTLEDDERGTAVHRPDINVVARFDRNGKRLP